jgi:hypothetical protein
MENPVIPDFLVAITRAEDLVDTVRSQRGENPELLKKLREVETAAETGREIASNPSAYNVSDDELQNWAEGIGGKLDELESSRADFDLGSADELSAQFQPLQERLG